MNFQLAGSPLAKLLTATALSLTAATAQAVTYVETFDNPLNSAIWDVTTGGNDWVVDGGVLTISRTNSDSGRMVFQPQIMGDFVVQFDYTVNWDISYAFGQRLQLGLSTVDAPLYNYGVLSIQEGATFGFAVDPTLRFGSSGGPIFSGTLRVTRVGSDLTMQYLDNNGNWVTSLTDVDDRDMVVSLDNYIFQGFTAGTSLVIDNFSITAEQFSAPVPEPETWAMLLAGLGLVGWRIRGLRG